MHAWLRQGADGGARGAAPGAGAGPGGAAVTVGDDGQGALTPGDEPQSPPWWRGVATDSPAGWPKSGQPGAHASVSRRIRTTTEYQ